MFSEVEEFSWFADTEQRERLNVRIREVNTDVVSWSLGTEQRGRFIYLSD